MTIVNFLTLILLSASVRPTSVATHPRNPRIGAWSGNSFRPIHKRLGCGSSSHSIWWFATHRKIHLRSAGQACFASLASSLRTSSFMTLAFVHRLGLLQLNGMQVLNKECHNFHGIVGLAAHALDIQVDVSINDAVASGSKMDTFKILQVNINRLVCVCIRTWDYLGAIACCAVTKQVLRNHLPLLQMSQMVLPSVEIPSSKSSYYHAPKSAWFWAVHARQ